MEADVRRFYGENAAELSARQLHVRLGGLPDDAAVWAAEGWGVDRELRVVTVELLDGILKTLARLGGVSKSKVGKPLHIPRPAELKRQKQKSTAKSWVEFAKSLMRKG